MLHDASISTALANFATHFINDLGYGGVFLLCFASAIIIVPGDEVTMLFAGFSVYNHHLSLVGIIIFGALGDVLGGLIAYAIGYFGLHEALEKLPGPLNVTAHGMERAEGWLEKYGTPVFGFSRLIPLGRAAFPYLAGITKTPMRTYLLPTTIGSIVWIAALGGVGDAVGKDYDKVKNHLEYVDYAVVAVVVVLVAWWAYARVWKPRRAASNTQTGVD